MTTPRPLATSHPRRLIVALASALVACASASSTPARGGTAQTAAEGSERCPEGTIRVVTRVGQWSPTVPYSANRSSRCMPPDEATRMRRSGSYTCIDGPDESLDCTAPAPDPQARPR